MQGIELRKLRERAGMTQSEFAEALDFSPTFIGQMERGDKPIEHRTELAARFVARLRREPRKQLRLRASDIDWVQVDDRWTAQIGPFSATLIPKSKGRWRVSLREGDDGYSPPWPLWEANLESAKAAAMLNAQHGIMDLEDANQAD